MKLFHANFSREYNYSAECQRHDCPKDDVYTWLKDRTIEQAREYGLISPSVTYVDTNFSNTETEDIVRITVTGMAKSEN
jgi:hypothetical protein